MAIAWTNGWIRSEASWPAITRNAFGSGTAWYVSTKLDGEDVAGLLLDAVRTAGIDVGSRPPAGLEVVTRSTGADDFTFLINHTDADAEYPASGRDLLSGGHISGTAVIPAGTVCVIHTAGETR